MNYRRYSRLLIRLESDGPFMYVMGKLNEKLLKHRK